MDHFQMGYFLQIASRVFFGPKSHEKNRTKRQFRRGTSWQIQRAEKLVLGSHVPTAAGSLSGTHAFGVQTGAS
jgi:hypothetical protein